MYFAKHETFHIRDGWLYKGLKALTEDELIFLAEDAPERLGLGKNMVRALRFWMQATGLAHEEFSSGRKAQFLTPIGSLVLEYDPYLEHEGTIWLLHHHLISSYELATTWYWFFNHYVPVTFVYQDFSERLQQWINIQRVTDTKSVAESSLRKDFDCLLRTYLPRPKGKLPEDVMESPFSALSLLTTLIEKDEDTQRHIRIYRFETGAPRIIPPLVFLYVLLKSQERERPSARQVGLSDALREPMNVGRTFNIGMIALEDLLTELEDAFPDLSVRLTRTAGLDQLTLPHILADDVLEMFYKEQRAIEEVRPSWSLPIN